MLIGKDVSGRGNYAQVDQLFSRHNPNFYEKYPRLRQEIAACAKPAVQPFGDRAALQASALAAVLVKAVVGEVYKSIQQSISNRAERIAAASKKAGTVRLVTKKNNDWTSAKCLIVHRHTKGKEDVGLFLLFDKRKEGRASLLVPRIYLANNSIAVTEAEKSNKPASIKANFGIALHAVISDAKKQKTTISEVGAVSASTGKLNFGVPKFIDCPKDANAAYVCENATSLIADPPTDLSALMIAVNVDEIGTSANAKALAASANSTLDEIAKPVLDEIVKQVSAQING